MMEQINNNNKNNKKVQLSLTNPRDAKACQKLLQFDVLTTLSLTILLYLDSFSCCCIRNPQNPKKFSENSNLYSSRSSKVIDIGVNRKPICDLLLVINCNFSRPYLLPFSRYWRLKIENHWIYTPHLLWGPSSGGTPLDIEVIYIYTAGKCI